MDDPKAQAKHHAEMLVTAELLTQRQAEAYVFREIWRFSRQETADAMGVSKSYVDNLRATAMDKIEAAEQTVDTLEEIDESIWGGRHDV